MLAAPAAGMAARDRVPALDRQHKTFWRIQSVIEHPRHPRALFRIGQFGIGRIDIVGQRSFLLQPMRGILERRQHIVRRKAELLRGAFGKALGVLDLRFTRILDAGDQVGILPDRHAVLAPVQAERPARQAFAGIPFALPVMQQAAGRETRAQLSDQLVGQRALGRADGGDVPFRCLEIVDGDEGRLAAHGQPHVAFLQIGVDLLAEPVEPRPGFIRERLCDPRRLADALDVHLEREFDIGKAGGAGDRRRRAVVRRGRNGDVPLARQHARGDVETDPAGAGQIDFRPGVQVGEIVLDLARAFDRIDVGTELDQIARDEARGEAEMAQRLDQQPCRVAARTGAGAKRLLRRLDARLHADDVADFLLQLRVEIDQEIDGAVGLARNLLQVGGEQRPGRHGREIGRKLGLEVVGVLEWKAGGIGLDEEVERIDHRHLRREVDLDLELRRLLGKDKTRQPIALRILLPVHEMVCRRDLERVAQDRRARMRRRAQANGLRAEVDRSVVFVMRDVMQCDEDRHGRWTPAAFLSRTPVPGGIKH